MGPRMYWTPGTPLPDEYTEKLREGMSGLRHTHIVASAFFSGFGHAGILLSQWDSREWAVWRVDQYGNPKLFDVVADRSRAEGQALGLIEESFPPAQGD